MKAQVADSLTADSQILSPMEYEAAEYGADDLDTAAVLAEMDDAQADPAPATEKPAAPTPARANGKASKIAPERVAFKEEIKRMPTAEVLQRLEAGEFIGQQAADAVRAMQTRMNTVNVEHKTLRREMEETLRGLRAQRPGTQPQEEPNPDQALLQHITPQQKQLFVAMAKELGYVRSEELTAQKTEEEAATFVNTSIEQAMERFGETFGFKDEEGQFHVNPEMQDKLNSTLERLEHPAQGVTPPDLFILANFDDLIQQARMEERAAVEAEFNGQRQQRVQRAVRGQTVQRSGAGTSRARLYDAARDRGNTSKVIDRAWALLDRNLPS